MKTIPTTFLKFIALLGLLLNPLLCVAQATQNYNPNEANEYYDSDIFYLTTTNSVSGSVVNYMKFEFELAHLTGNDDYMGAFKILYKDFNGNFVPWIQGDENSASVPGYLGNDNADLPGTSTYEAFGDNNEYFSYIAIASNQSGQITDVDDYGASSDADWRFLRIYVNKYPLIFHELGEVEFRLINYGNDNDDGSWESGDSWTYNLTADFRPNYEFSDPGGDWMTSSSTESSITGDITSEFAANFNQTGSEGYEQLSFPFFRKVEDKLSYYESGNSDNYYIGNLISSGSTSRVVTSDYNILSGDLVTFNKVGPDCYPTMSQVWVEESNYENAYKYYFVSQNTISTSHIPAPTLTIDATNASKTILNWTSNSSISHDKIGYKIYKSSDNIYWANIASTAAGVNTLIDSDVTPGVLTYYKVTPIMTQANYKSISTDLENGLGGDGSYYAYGYTSIHSAIGSITPIDIPLVQNFTASNNQCDKIILNWDPPTLGTTVGFTSGIKYTIYRAPIGNDQVVGTYSLIQNDLDATTYTDASVSSSPGSQYSYKIKTKMMLDTHTSHSSSFNSVVKQGEVMKNASAVSSFSANYANNALTISIDKSNFDYSINKFKISYALDGGSYADLGNQVIIDSTTAYTTVNNTEVYNFIDSTTTFTACETYNFKVITNNCQNQDSPSTVVPELIQPSGSIFDNTHALSATTGDFGNRIQLNWSANNAQAISSYSILRRLANSNEVFSVIASVSTDISNFDDLYANANTVYEYKVNATIDCNTVLSITESNTAIGFRVPTAKLSGNIHYENGIAVESVDILLNSAEQNPNKVIEFDGVDDYFEIPFLTHHTSTNEYHSFSFSAWVKKDQYNTNDNSILSFSNNLNPLVLSLNANQVILSDNNINVSSSISSEEWNHLTFTYNSSTHIIKVYVNGIEKIDTNFTLMNSNQAVLLGKKDLGNNVVDFFEGRMDEICFWDKALSDSEVQEISNRFINPNSQNLIAYFHCDVNTNNPTNLYDCSESNGVLHHNNLVFNGATLIEDESVSPFVNYRGLTSQNGFYLIEGIRYQGTGSLFDVTPLTHENFYTTPHEFNPNVKTEYLGDVNTYAEHIDFVDVSSFQVTGQLLFDVHTAMQTSVENAYSIPVEAVEILVDGRKQVNAQNEDIVSDADGNFTIEVPIGTHTLSFKKDGHIFEFKPLDGASSNEFYDFSSTSEPYDFQQSIHLNDFAKLVCTSTKDMIVRVTGGLKHQNIDLGWAYTQTQFTVSGTDTIYKDHVNTIGEVRFDMIPEGDLNNASGHKVLVSTDVLTGEVEVELLPIKYQILKSSFEASNPQVQAYYTANDFVFDLIDCTVKGQVNQQGVFEEDTLFSIHPNAGSASTASASHTLVNGEYYHNDSLKVYNHDFELIYRTNPILVVRQVDDNGTVADFSDDTESEYLGESSFTTADGGVEIVNTNATDVVADGYQIGTGSNKYPIFFEEIENGSSRGIRNYRLALRVQEPYEYYGAILSSGDATKLKDFSSPVTEGTIQINNELGSTSTDPITVDEEVEYYTFNPNNAHVFGADHNFLRNLSMNYQNGTLNASFSQDAFVFGEKSFGNAFFTAGPQQVDYVLRDPAGDGSYAKIEEGSSLSHNYAFSLDHSGGFHVVQQFKLGSQWSVGFGIQVQTKIHNTFGIDVTTTLGEKNNRELNVSKTFTESISSSSLEQNVGAKGDVFIGSSTNILYAQTKDVGFVPISSCSQSTEIACLNEGDSGIVIPVTSSSGVVVNYTIGNQLSIGLVPSTATRFAYSANYIQNYIIPALTILRNAEFLKPNVISNLPVDHTCYGENNDSPCFNDFTNLIGANKSYSYIASQNEPSITENVSEDQFLDHTFGSLLDVFMDENSEDYEVLDGGEMNEFSDDFISDLEDFLEANDAQDYDTYLKNVPGVLNISNLIADLNHITDSPESVQIHIPNDKIRYYNQQIDKWRRALAKNELDKYTSEFITNHSFSSGLEQDFSESNIGSYHSFHTTTYTIDSEIGLNLGAEVGGTGVEGEIKVKYELNGEDGIGNEVQSQMTTSYHIADNDPGDVISMDVRDSKLNWSPVFKTLGGATSCPWELAVEYEYLPEYINDSEEFYFNHVIRERVAELRGMLSETVENMHTFTNPSHCLNYLQISENGTFSYVNSDVIDITPSWSDYVEVKNDDYYFGTCNNPQFYDEHSEFKAARHLVYHYLFEQHPINSIYSEYNAIKTSLTENGVNAAVVMAATSQRDKPTLDISPNNLYNVPEQEAGVFTLTLGNESEDNSTRIYHIEYIESSNQNGAIIQMDGEILLNRFIQVEAGSSVSKIVTVGRGPDSLSYNDLKIVIYPECQYNYGTTFEKSIADTVTFSVHFLPTCTDVTLYNQEDDWIVNTEDQVLEQGAVSTPVSLAYTGYDANYYSLQDFEFQYKMGNEDWIGVNDAKFVNPNYVLKQEDYPKMDVADLQELMSESFNVTTVGVVDWLSKLEPTRICAHKTANPNGCVDIDNNPSIEDWVTPAWNSWNTANTSTINSDKSNYITAQRNLLIGEYKRLITHSSYKTDFVWNVPQVDGPYEIRVKSNCGEYTDPLYPSPQPVEVYSESFSGLLDRIRPENFGAPQPADGLLEPNDEVKVTFNEAINEYAFNSSFAATDVEVKAVKNNSEIRHDAFLNFDGSQSMNIPTGVNIAQSSFTFETWVNLSSLPELGSTRTLFKQGVIDDGQQLKLEALYDGRLKLSNIKNGNVNHSDSKSVTSTSVIPTDTWKHIAVSYDVDNGEVAFVVNGNVAAGDVVQLTGEYLGEGAITVGENLDGSMHEMRIWRGVKFPANIYANMLTTLSGQEANLLGYWPMNELSGNPKDKARSRHATTTAQWAVSSSGNAYTFNNPSGTSSVDYLLNENFGAVAFEESHDFTVEFWVKGNQGTVFSNGSYIGSETLVIDSVQVANFGNLNGWSIGFDEGKLQVDHNVNADGISTQLMQSPSVLDVNTWHHIALVKNAKSNTRLYVDGNEVASIASENTKGFAGKYLCLGAKILKNSNEYNLLSLFTGSVDEVRIWSKAKTVEQIQSEMSTKLSGDELGLVLYYPFDEASYSASTGTVDTDDYVASSGEIIDLVDENNIEQSDVADFDLSGIQGADVPLVSLSNSKTSVAFNKISNGDQVLIELTEDLANIENCIVDVTIDKVYDLNGNQMEAPLTWSFYVDKNQLIWDEQFIEKEKLLGVPMVFETYIINQGGQVEQFEISNLPAWLTAIPSEGLLEPNSFQQIEFVVNEDLFIGDYQEDIILTGNNEYGERLEFKLEVEAPAPVYDFDPSDYLYTMNFVGKVTVDEMRSRDDKDILFAYVGEEVRGVTNLIYLEDYDAYFAFFSVYSNTTSGEQVSFRLWDASEGKIQSQIKLSSTVYPNTTNPITDVATVPFLQGDVIGSFTDLTHFAASNMLRQEIPLNDGWNWVSFNLNDEQDNDLTNLSKETILANVDNNQIEIIKNQTTYAQSYEGSILGSLSTFDIEPLYMFKMVDNSNEVIIYEGKALNPADIPISINEGWNWIGYIGQRMLSTNEALSSLNPSSGDIIKSQTAFSMYANESLGWLGTLSNMKAGEGYMLKHSGSATLTYPESSMFGGASFRLDKNQYPVDKWLVNPSKYEHSMSVIAQIDHPDYYEPAIENILGAFSSKHCVGNITATLIAKHESLYFLTVYGNEDDLIHFDYYDKHKDKTYRAENVIHFEANQLYGSIENPYPIQIDVETQDIVENYLVMDVYPNPFDDQFALSFSIEESAAVKVQLYDMLGRFVREVSNTDIDAGSHKLNIESKDLAKGAYFVEIQIGDKSYKKMIVKS